MPGQAWELNTSGGYYANPELSKEAFRTAQPLMKFKQFVRPVKGFGKNKGDRIDFNRLSNVQGEGGEIGEFQTVPESGFAIDRGNLIVKEYGLSIPYTEKLEMLAELNVESDIIQALKDDQAKVLDKVCANQFKASKLKYTPTGNAGAPTYTLATGGIVGTAATRHIQAFDVKEIVDYMKSVLLVPKFDGENYICICSTGFTRSIKNDADWETAASFGDPDRFFSGEIGRYEGVRFIEESNVLANVLGTTAYKGEAIFFGKNPVVEGVANPPELRAKIATDYGRSKGIAWLFLGGYKIVWESANAGEANIIHVTST